MIWVGHVENKCVPFGLRTSWEECTWHRWEDNIKMHLKETR